MDVVSRMLLTTVLLIGSAAATSRPLTDAETTTLHSWHDGPDQTAAATRLAQQLGREGNADALPVLLETKNPAAMSAFKYGNANIGHLPITPDIQALAVAVVKDPSFNEDDAAWDTRYYFLMIVGQFQSAELFQLYYDSVKWELAERRRLGPYQMPSKRRFWIDVAFFPPRLPIDVPDLDDKLANLLPLIDDSCNAYSLVHFLQDRKYVPAVGRMSELYLRTGIKFPGCNKDMTYALSSFHSALALQAIVQRIHWLLKQPPGAGRDQELQTAVSTLGYQPAEAQVDLVALEHDVLNAPLESALKSDLQAMFVKQHEFADQATVVTIGNFVNLIARGQIESVRSMIQHGADVNAVADIPAGGAMPGSTMLHVALTNGHADIAELLIGSGADVNKPDHNRSAELPLQTLVGSGFLSQPKDGPRLEAMIDLLLTHGAQIDARNPEGGTALHEAARRGNLIAVASLLRAGAGPNVRDTGGFTPLHFAARMNFPAVVRYLLDHKADINAKTSDGMTPLIMATASGSHEMMKLLIDRGADVNLAAKEDVTAILLAHEAKDQEAERMLRTAGAHLNPITAAKRKVILWMMTGYWGS